MAKNNTNPQVRFAGYTEDWEERDLVEILTERKVLQKISEDAPILAFAAGQGVIDRSERKSNNRDHLTLDQGNKIYKLTELNDIVYNPSNLKYGAIDRNKLGRGVISPIYVTFTTKIEPSFVELIVKSEKFKLRALQYEEGTVVKRQSVKPENLLSLKVNISPSKEEQKQIGQLFDRLDFIIKYHKINFDKLTTIKKAMLEKMFPKYGNILPEVRFSEFDDAWTKCKLDDRANFSKGQGYSKKDLVEKGTPIILYGSLYTNYQSIISEVNTFVNANNDAVYSTGKEVIVPASGESAEDIARASALIQSGVILGGDLNIIYPDSSINSTFLALSISNGTQQKKLTKLAQGKSVVHLRNKDLKQVEILYPSLDEQTKIGTFFQQIDNLIGLHKKEYEKIKNIKKACFEKMTNSLSGQNLKDI
jgi:type I restriction enzyme S subunit